MARRRSDPRPGAEEATREFYEANKSPVSPSYSSYRRGRQRRGDQALAPTTPEEHGQLVLPGMGRDTLQHAVPYHAMNREQFAAQPEVWFHGRYGEEPPEADTAAADIVGVHAGTRQSALDRLKKVGPYDPNRAAENMPKVPGMAGREEPPEEQPGRLFPMVNTGKMRNSPARAVRDPGESWQGQIFNEQTGERRPTGWYYHNDIEDEGSVSIGFAQRHGGPNEGPNLSTHADLIKHQAQINPSSVHPNMRHLAEHGAEHTGEEIWHPEDEGAPINEDQFRQQVGSVMHGTVRHRFEQKTGLQPLFVNINEGNTSYKPKLLPTEGGGTIAGGHYKDESHYMTHEGWEAWKARMDNPETAPKLKAGPSKPAF